jgi:hypothetical protein
VGVGVGSGLGIVTPLFHTSFLPLFMHVYFLPLAVAVDPAFLQMSPGFTAECPSGDEISNTKKTPSAIRLDNFLIIIFAPRKFEKLFLPK